MSDIKVKNMVVIGVSNNREKYGYKIFRDLLRAKYKVSGVNPAGGEVEGQKIFRKLADVSPKPDMVITVVQHAVTEQIVEQCRELGINEIWMQPGSESEAAISKAREYGIKVTHSACIMIQDGVW